MNGSLYLFPEDAFASPPATSILLDALYSSGTLGKELESQRFMVGEGFFRHISFAGCSPTLQLEPPREGSTDFTHISLVGPFPAPRLITTRHHGRPRCPHCGKRIEGWKSSLDNWQKNPATEYMCTNCGQSSMAAALDWRRHAACGRLMVEIHQVFPGEAVPADGLLNKLKKTTGVTWVYAWADSSSG